MSALSSADISHYCYANSCSKHLTFQTRRITANAVIVYQRKSYRSPCAQGILLHHLRPCNSSRGKERQGASKQRSNDGAFSDTWRKVTHFFRLWQRISEEIMLWRCNKRLLRRPPRIYREKGKQPSPLTPKLIIRYLHGFY